MAMITRGICLQMYRVTKEAKENAQGGYQKPFNTNFFDDT